MLVPGRCRTRSRSCDERRLALELRGELRGARGERRESLDRRAHLGVARRVVAHGDRRQLARQRVATLLLRGEVARRASPAPARPPAPSPTRRSSFAELSRTAARRRSSSCFDLGRHRRELLDARAEVLAVDGDRLDLRVEHLEHRAEVRPERTRADRTGAALAELDDLVALLLDVVQLRRAALGASSPPPACREPSRSARSRTAPAPARARRASASSSSATSGSSAGAVSILARRSRSAAELLAEQRDGRRSASCGAPASFDAALELREAPPGAPRKRRQLARERFELLARRR